MLLSIGDVVKMKKAHPCGSDLWKITFVGSDIKMRLRGLAEGSSLWNVLCLKNRVRRIERAASDPCGAEAEQ